MPPEDGPASRARALGERQRWESVGAVALMQSATGRDLDRGTVQGFQAEPLHRGSEGIFLLVLTHFTAASIQSLWRMLRTFY